MSTEMIASHIQMFADYVQTQPLLIFLFIIFFMAVESSFIPFPSEVVMIPAGFLAYRYELVPGCGHWGSLLIAILCGLVGSMIGAYVNYYLSAWLGRPFLHKYGKYFFLKEEALDRAEEIFRKYGDVVTFVCRLLPAIRQLISIPAGLSRMNVLRFSIFTALGAGFWTAILAGIGFYFGKIASGMSYQEMVEKGVKMIHDHYLWILLGLVIFVAVYFLIHKMIMNPSKKGKNQSVPEGKAS